MPCDAPRNGQEFMLARFRVANGIFGERAVLLDRTPASANGASGALRIGPDGKLYRRTRQRRPTSASPEASRPITARCCGSTLMRPRPTTSRPEMPIFSLDHPQPQALDWQPASGNLWVVDRVGADAGRLSAVVKMPKQKPRRVPHVICAARRHRRSLGGVLSRRFDADLQREPVHRGRDGTGAHSPALRSGQSRRSIVSVERMLNNQIGGVRVVSDAPDGGLYVATESVLYRLAP